jgi:hypothetical protein
MYQEEETMQFLMLTYVSEAGSDAYERQTEEERQAGRMEHVAWFQENGSVIKGGHELAWPRRVGRIGADRQMTFLDGPFAETKEALGGIIVLDAASLEEATRIASGWPSLGMYPGAWVEVIPVSEDGQ